MTKLDAYTEKQFESLRSRRQEIADALSGVIAGEIRFGRHDRQLYSTDASIYQVEPLGLIVPNSVDDAVAAAQYCLNQGIPLLPRGGGTSLAGQCTSEAAVLDLSARCDKILNIDPANRACQVEPGITIDALNRVLASDGLFFAPDPATVRQATIGGCIGNNAAGTRSIKYGRTSENVLAVDVLLGNATRVRLDKGAADRDPVAKRLTEGVINIVQKHELLIDAKFPKTLRRNAGYGLDSMLQQMRSGEPINLASLMCGSEGTLALTLGATLKLRRIPKHRALVVMAFDSLDDAIECVPDLLTLGPAAVELLDDLIISTAMENLEHRGSVSLLPQPQSGELKAILYVEFEGDDEAGFDSQCSAIREMVPRARAELYTSAGAIRKALMLRQAGEPLLHSIPGQRKPLGFVEDNVVPVERLGEFVRDFRKIIESHGTTAAFYAHASVGVLHVRPLLDLRSGADRVAMFDIATRAAELARSLGGVMSGEHGDGRARGPMLEKHFGPELMGAFRGIKSLFDPENLLNPGNIVWPMAVPSIAEQTRVRPGEQDISILPVKTCYSYGDQHGFAHAVERCNGAGVCRKLDEGTMCPSYMATKDERHSTRGRGNAIRLALSGQTSSKPLDWNDPETMQTLDMCLSCKGCKRECPSNVDISRLKSEYTAQRYAESGVPISAKVFANFRRLNRFASRFSKLSNWATKPGIIRSVMNRFGGIPAQRTLPSFAPSLANDESWNRTDDAGLPTVVLFGDCFSMFTETGLGLDAKALLEAFGYRVVLADMGCCQRPAISNGLLPEAIQEIDELVPRLNILASEHEAAAIIVLEPSCLSAIQDDWLGLNCETSLAERNRLADRCCLVEQFLEAQWDHHPRRPEFKPAAGLVVLHAHCHQKALLEPGSSSKLLQRAFGDAVCELDTGCCGMAGGFGMHTSRYDLSMKIGETRLFPAIRECSEGDVVLATGTSCRHQIRDGVQIDAVHPVSYLRQQLIWRQTSDESGLAPLFARG